MKLPSHPWQLQPYPPKPNGLGHTCPIPGSGSILLALAVLAMILHIRPAWAADESGTAAFERSSSVDEALVERWDAAYRDGRRPPWDTGRPASELVRLVESGVLRPCRVLELGCGSGVNAVFLASRGFEVTAIDLAPTALERAAKRATEAGVRVRWIQADVLAPPALEPFDLIFDRGCYHGVRRQNASGYVGVVERLCRPGGRILILAGNANEPGPAYGPPRVKESELVEDFSRAFRFENLRQTRFDTADPNAPGAWSWSVLLRRTQPSEPNPVAGPRRLKRSESFLGVHFDFHAGPDCTEIGRNTTREMIENIIDQIRPDYLQIDCKGHRGLSSYATKVGNPAPGFVGDPLHLWREVTAERGVALYMHYSGVWDTEAVRQHPDWAVVGADGKPSDRITSFWSPYAAGLLVPQLRELAGDYGVDGAWVDGECWAAQPDWGRAAVLAYAAATGRAEPPRGRDDPGWFEFMQFHREAFRRYLRGYIADVKSTHPDFQLCSNWAFTDHMPEPVSAPLDFLSGDYSPDDSVNSARLSARYLARQGVPWDLMAWSFSRKAGQEGKPAQKTAVQLQREAAVVLALGGGFQAYYKQKRDGSVYSEQMPVMAEVAAFCRAREAICHHAVQVPQVALLFSTPAHYRNCSGLFSRELSRLRGNLQVLLESQHSVEVLGEHHLSGRMQEYPLIIVPEWEYLDPPFRADLVSYVKGGGNLLLIGPRSAAMFPSELDIRLVGEPSLLTRRVSHDDNSTQVKAVIQNVEPGSRARPFGTLRLTADNQSDSRPAATITTLGQGRIAATYFTIGREYLGNGDERVRGFMDDLVRELFPDPMVEVTGSSDVDVTVNRIDGKLAINLVNTAGPHATAGILESIPAVGPLTIKVRQSLEPVRIALEPGARPLAYEYSSGEVHLTVPKVGIHEIVVIETN